MTGSTHYETLGVPEGASVAEIRKRYRELARQFHPDVARSPGAAARFKEINAAHQVLSDPERRGAYDAELRLGRARAAARQGQAHGVNPRGTEAGARAASSAARATTAPSGSRPRRTAGRTTAEQAAAVIAEAQAAFRQMRFREAEAACRMALRMDRRSAVAYEMLGDIHRARGHIDEAIAMYSYALQLDRHNRVLQVKFDRLVGQPAGRSGERPARPGGRSHRVPTVFGMPAARAAATVLGCGLLLFLSMVASMAPGPATAGWLPLQWSATLLFSLGMGGLVAGLLLSVNGYVARARDELAFTPAGRVRRPTVPLGGVLLAFALIWYYAAFALYVCVAYTHEAVTASLFRVFGGTFALMALFALACPDSALHLLLMGGNLVFPAMVAGWMLGDAFRD
ncbi:MAG: DnaJ domain-containing protein [Chthonomonadales bacterium]|nr:DnaJ domain-containing protein [Chthonomonadales bacterium]